MAKIAVMVTERPEMDAYRSDPALPNPTQPNPTQPNLPKPTPMMPTLSALGRHFGSAS
ncbi:hypothetical protein HALA3H3_700033 [Halomonas sp. A3H3]|nr:hypothetical protein HALA3H3_700033 [Halomonas sp. A3H3]